MTPAEIAAGVAADIRKLGHYRGIGRSWSRKTPDGKCCIYLSPASYAAGANAGLFFDEVTKITGRGAISLWNDHTPTETVLAVLDRIAAS